MKEVLKFLKENVNGFLATVEEGKPRVRPFQFMLEEDGRFLQKCRQVLVDKF